MLLEHRHHLSNQTLAAWAWRQLKQVELRNLVCLDLEELHGEFHLAVGRLRQKCHLVPSFFAGAGLEL